MAKKAVAGLKPKEMVQYCIDAYLFGDVMKSVPKSISIESVSFELGSSYKLRRRAAISNKMRKLGITSCRQTVPSIEYGVRIDGVGREALKKMAKELSKETNEDMDFARVSRLTLSYKESEATFNRTAKATKPDETDLRKKLKLLGLVSSEGNVVELIRELSASKYSCKFQRVFSDTIICSTKG